MTVLFKLVLLFYIFTSGNLVKGFGLLQNVQYSDKCLHVKESSKDNNADLEITTCDSSQPDQQLNVEDWANYGNSPGQIIFQFNQKCLTVNSAGQSNGDLINQYDCWPGATNQLWKILGSFDGNFQLQSQGSSKCLTAEGGGTYTDQWDCLGEAVAPHQTWRIVKSVNDGSGGGGVFAFENIQYSGKCLNAADGVGGTASNLNINDCDTTSPSQLLAATNLVSIQGPITFYGTNLCLNVYGESQNNGGQVGGFSCSTSNAKNEQWGLKLQENNPSVFQIVSGLSGKCITAESGGTWMDQWDCCSYENCPHQWWKFKIPSSPPSGLPSAGSLLESAVYRNKCLRIQSRSQDNNADLQLMNCNPADSAQVLNMNALAWDDLSSTPGSISFLSSSKCLTINGASTDNGARANQYDCVSPTPGNQQWKLVTANNDGYENLFELQSTGSGKCLTAEGDGSYLDQWDCYNYKSTPHQFWQIRPIDSSASGSHDDFSSYWQCNIDTGLLISEEYRNYTCGLYCTELYDADGTKGFTGGYCYKGYWGKRYCACVTAPILNDNQIILYKEKNWKGDYKFVGSKLHTKADCISFDNPDYKEWDNSAMKSIIYDEGLCISFWTGYNCGGRVVVYRSGFWDHYNTGDIPGRIYDGVRSISRPLC